MTSTSLATLLAAFAVVAAALPACSGGSTVVDEAESPPATPATNDAPAAESAAPAESAPPAETAAPPTSAAAPAPSGSAASGAKPGGASCDSAAECASGVCEGEGCGPGQGKCAEKDRRCTLDLRPYCGCDGKTFNAGGNCPKARFSKRGPCDGDPGPGPKLPAPKKAP